MWSLQYFFCGLEVWSSRWILASSWARGPHGIINRWKQCVLSWPQWCPGNHGAHTNLAFTSNKNIRRQILPTRGHQKAQEHLWEMTLQQDNKILPDDLHDLKNKIELLVGMENKMPEMIAIYRNMEVCVSTDRQNIIDSSSTTPPSPSPFHTIGLSWNYWQYLARDDKSIYIHIYIYILHYHALGAPSKMYLLKIAPTSSI